MELTFHKEPLRRMQSMVRQIQTREQTQELKLSEGMPDIGRILGSWGQPIMRSKEWNSDGISVSGGTMVWILYAPEDGTQPRCVTGWIPWQLDWDLPAGVPDGQIRTMILNRFVDARSVSPRKIMIRTGVSALGEGLTEDNVSTWKPGEVPEDVQLLETAYPVRMVLEAGEKAFLLDEELILPQSCSSAEKVLACTLTAAVTESRVLGSRLVFRGTANLHVVYACENGQLCSWDFPISISQYTELAEELGPDAQGEFWLMPTDLDVQLDDEGHFRLKCGMVAQYAVDDVQMVRMAEDAYSLSRELQMEQEELMLTPILEKRMMNLPVEQILPQEAASVADISFLPDFPRMRETEGMVAIEQPGQLQILYYSPDGSLQSAAARWEGRMEIPAHPDSALQAVPFIMDGPEVQITGEGIRLRGQLPMVVRTTVTQAFSPVSGIQLGEEKKPDPDRASLILCRAGEKSLWQLARESGSTVHAIQDASGLEGEPEPNRMLLIPVL